MAISALTAARYLCERSGWTLTNLALQKMLYLAHMVYMGQNGTSKKPLINEHFEAWDYGPVVPALYHRLKAFGSDPVWNMFLAQPDISDPGIRTLLDDCADQLGHLKPGTLVNMTHQQDGAWANHYRAGARGIRIPDDEIFDEYSRRFGADKRVQESA